MAEIRPFRGLRYGAKAGRLDSLVAPPYDVLTPKERDAYAAKNPYNIVHLTLPEAREDDRSKFVKYARSSALLSEWRRDGALELEPQPALYRYTQTFSVEGRKLTRVSLITLIKVEPFEKGIVLPHEQTFPKHKEDRLRILEATRSHLECIFGLFEDPGGAVLTSLAAAPVSGTWKCTGEDGVQHVLEPIVDAAALESLKEAFSNKRIWIADGHHRYETALAFRQALGDRDLEVPEDFMVISLASMSDPGLVLLPTHRISPTLKNWTQSEAIAALSSHFQAFQVASKDLVSAMRAAASDGSRVFGVALRDGRGLLLTAKNDEALIAAMPGDGSSRLKELDVSVLHRSIFGSLLGLGANEPIIYTRDAEEAVELANRGDGAAFMMLPPTVDDMKAIALGGERMPQKSTFYYPKVLSGLVVWSLMDF